VAIRSSTLGVGLEIGKLIADHFGIRVGANYFKFSTSATKSNVSYDASLKLHAVTGLVDFFPSARGSFHLTGGIITNPFTASGTGQPDAAGTFTLNGHTYTTAQVGILSGEAKYPDAGPVGLGFDAREEGPFALLRSGSDVGQLTVTLTATGAASNPQLARTQAQADTTQHDIRYARSAVIRSGWRSVLGRIPHAKDDENSAANQEEQKAQHATAVLGLPSF
jgi:hypothetical protein